VERNRMMTGAALKPGDALLGLPSSGLHTNGYSLARKLFFEVARYAPDKYLPELGCSLADELLKVHKSYLKAIQSLHVAGLLKGAAHITGGGITDNTPRILPPGLATQIDAASWKIPAVFELMRKLGRIPEDDFRRTFNLGIGMILAVSPRKLSQAKKALDKLGEPYHEIGRVILLPPGAKSRVIYI